jgi:hypothetical protein
MSHVQGNLGRIVAAVALATVLSLAAPARANAAVGRTSPASDPWSWLKGWWQGGVVELVRGWTAGAPRTASPAALQEKDGTCSPTNPAACLPPPPPPGGGQGVGTDPDGKP